MLFPFMAAYIVRSYIILKITIIIATTLSLYSISFLVYGNGVVNSAVYAQQYIQIQASFVIAFNPHHRIDHLIRIID